MPKKTSPLLSDQAVEFYTTTFGNLKGDKKMEYTKGPWLRCDRYDLRHNPCGIDIVDSNKDRMICRMPDGALVHGGYAFKTTYANSHLISACPEMYEALTEIEKYWTVCKIKVPAGLRNQIRTAIAKAEGEPNA